MNAGRCSHRTRAHWMALATLCGALWGPTPSAHGQNDRIGTVLGVPAADLDRFEEVNASPGVDRLGRLLLPNTVRLLHLSPRAGDPFGTEIATVSITVQGSGEKATSVYFPLDTNGGLSPLYMQINASDSFLNPTIVRAGNRAALRVAISQSDLPDLDLGRTHFLLVPADRVGSLEVTNPSVKFTGVHLQRTAIDGGPLWVELVAIDESNTSAIKIPSADLAQAIMALNSNVVVQSAAGSSFYEITTISVN
jgi:hypothetical protein